MGNAAIPSMNRLISTRFGMGAIIYCQYRGIR